MEALVFLAALSALTSPVLTSSLAELFKFTATTEKAERNFHMYVHDKYQKKPPLLLFPRQVCRQLLLLVLNHLTLLLIGECYDIRICQGLYFNSAD